MEKMSASIVETERLIVEEATLEDSPFFLALLNSPNWIEFIGDRGIKTEKDARIYIQKSLIESYQKNGFGLYKMVHKEENKAIGICGFIKRDYLENADIGFAILPEYEGKGYTYEAAKEIMKYGYTSLGLNPILAITTAENFKSRNLLSKIGLKEMDLIKPTDSDEELLRYSSEK